jgi:hypothetical protein
VVCRDIVTSVKTSDSDCENIEKPPTIRSCNTMPCLTAAPPTTAHSFFWKPKEFRRCSVSCGGGVQTRRVVCRDIVTSVKTSDSDCANIAKPATVRSCNTMPCFTAAPPTIVEESYVWKAMEFGRCTSTCGIGVQIRKVLCVHETTMEETSDSNCVRLVKPQTIRVCIIEPCAETLRN